MSDNKPKTNEVVDTEPKQAAPAQNTTTPPQGVSTKGAVDMEGAVTGNITPNIDGGGRSVDPEKDENDAINTDTMPVDEHMRQILEHVPENLRERVSQLTRAELSMPGNPKDREAYEAYLVAEKIIRDLRRREEKANLDFSTVPRQTG